MFYGNTTTVFTFANEQSGTQVTKHEKLLNPLNCSRQCLNVLWSFVFDCTQLSQTVHKYAITSLITNALVSIIPTPNINHINPFTDFQVIRVLNILFFKEMVLVFYIQANCLIFILCILWCQTVFYHVMNFFFKNSKQMCSVNKYSEWVKNTIIHF